MKFTFVSEDEPVIYGDNVSAKRTFVFEADSLNQILEQFESFLRGSGFYFDGTIDVINDEDEIISNEEGWDFSDIPQNNWPFADSEPEKVSKSKK